MQVSCILIWVRVCNVIVKYAEIYMQLIAAYTLTPRPTQVQTICFCGSNYIFINI